MWSVVETRAIIDMFLSDFVKNVFIQIFVLLQPQSLYHIM